MARRRLFGAAVVVAAVMSGSVGAKADFRTGNQLYAECTSSNAADRNFCLGYIAAITDAARKGVIAPGSVLGWTHCVRDEVSIKLVHDVVVQFLATHPEKRDLTADGLVAEALAEAFPCRR
jgi:hypothetical protein